MSRIDKSIEIMNDYITLIKEKASFQLENVDDKAKEQINVIVNKTLNTITNSIDTLNSIKEQALENESLDDQLTVIENKCKEVTRETINKIEGIKLSKDTVPYLKKELKDNYILVKKEVNKKVSNNESLNNVLDLLNNVKDKTITFYNDPKTQKFINETKLTIIKLADKGLDKLKVLLDRQDNDN